VNLIHNRKNRDLAFVEKSKRKKKNRTSILQYFLPSLFYLHSRWYGNREIGDHMC
jgi:hypothetical protein